MDFICFKIPYEYRPCLDLKLKKITPRTRPQIRLYGVKNTACTGKIIGLVLNNSGMGLL